MRLAGMVVVGLLAGTETAQATCADVSRASEPDGLAPRSGVIFAEGKTPIPLRWSGPPGKAAQTQVSERIVRLDYEAGDATGLKLPDHWIGPLVFGDRSRPRSAVRVRSLGHHEGDFGCSRWDLIGVGVDQAVAAFRVRWTSSRKASEWIEVASTRDGSSSVVMGMFGCFARHTLDLDEIHRGGVLELVAIHFDGSESPVEGLPMWVKLETERDHDRREPPSDDDPPLLPFALLLISGALYRPLLRRATGA